MRITEEGVEGLLRWISLDVDFKPWFEGDFELPGLAYIQGTNQEVGQRIQQILEAICTLSPTFLLNQTCLTVETRLEFPRLWGLGSSSTLIALVAEWGGVNPYKLLKSTFGGSGYDIAAAIQPGPFTYRTGNPPQVMPVRFAPPFLDQLYFVYLGQKQDSREGIARYRERQPVPETLIDQVSAITRSFLNCQDLADFEKLIREHEELVGNLLDLPRARDPLFRDFWGEIKSLGAWGGDFVLATSDRPALETQGYFNEKGFSVFLPYQKLILNDG